LINLNDKVKVTYVGKSTYSGNGEIQKCFIKGDPAIPNYWEFVAKRQKGDTVAVQKVRFNAEAMALRLHMRAVSNGSQSILPNLKDSLFGGTVELFGRC
jgi:hypothetical protein